MTLLPVSLFRIKMRPKSKMATTVYGKKNEFMSYDTYMERKSPVDIYTVMKLKTLKLIIALSSFKSIL